MTVFVDSLLHSLLSIVFFVSKCNTNMIQMEYNALNDIIRNKHTSPLHVIDDVSNEFNITIHLVDENNTVLTSFIKQSSMYEFYIKFMEDKFSFMKENIITTSFISSSSN